MDIKFFRGAFFKRKIKLAHHITQYIRCGLTPLPFGTLLPLVATSYMLETLNEIVSKRLIAEEDSKGWKAICTPKNLKTIEVKIIFNGQI